MSRILSMWRAVRDSLWFVPGSIVLLACTAAVGLIEVDYSLEPGALEAFPRLFGTGAAGARSMLETIAGSMITIAGVAFSITLVALSLAASQYSSRVLRNFVADRTNQVVLGVFVGIFAYCLVVLRTIREGESASFVPSLAVLGGAVLALAGIALFVYFIHHVATSIQASHIIARINRETMGRIEHLFPEGVGDERPCRDDAAVAALGPASAWRPVPAERTGYVQGFEPEAVLAAAGEFGAVVRMEVGIGDFVAEGQPIASILSDAPPTESTLRRIVSAYAVAAQRTIDQDAAFGIRQLVDVALKALSPSLNDTTTAIMVLDHLTAILARLGSRRIASPCRFTDGRLRLITRGPTFEALVDLAFGQIRQNASGNIAVLERLLAALESLEREPIPADRRRVLLRHAVGVDEAVRLTIPAATDRESLAPRTGELLRSLRADPRA